MPISTKPSNAVKADAGEITKTLRWLARETEFVFAAEQLNAAAALIESMQAQLAEREREAQRWIPVSERLPEAYIPVLVHRVHSYCDNDGYSDIRITARTNVINRGVADWMETGYAYIVTHWMPLPAPPEKGE